MIPTVLAVDDDRHGLAFVARPDCQVLIADDRVRAITLAENVDRLDFVTANYNMPGMTRDEIAVRICTSGHIEGALNEPPMARQLRFAKWSRW